MQIQTVNLNQQDSLNAETVSTPTVQKAMNLIPTQEILLDTLNIEIDIEHIDAIAEEDNEAYALLRKNGLGTSDSSSVLEVNPYTSREQLIEEKARTYITEEEKAVGDKVAVRKGRELEPLIIDKFQRFFNQPNLKPPHQYKHKEFPFIKFNFDGVTFSTNAEALQYIPCEIKVITYYGEKNYDFSKAMFIEGLGFQPLPEDVSKRNWSIEDKAFYYGIPPYYYTQLQQQILGLNAPFGYLSVLQDTKWRFYTYLIYRDDALINNLIVEGYKVWNAVLERRGVQ